MKTSMEYFHTSMVVCISASPTSVTIGSIGFLIKITKCKPTKLLEFLYGYDYKTRQYFTRNHLSENSSSF